MKPIEIAASYDSIAGRWLEPKLQTNGLAQLERALQFVPEGRLALDVGCGCSGRFSDLLQSRGFSVEGIDISGRMIAMAEVRSPGVRFYLDDICTWELPGKYDFISAWDSTWHLPLSEQEPVMRKLCAGLTPGGVLIFTTGGLDGPAEKTDSCMGPPMYYSVLGIPKTLELLARFECVCRHLEYDQYPEKHLYIIAQKAA